MAQRENATVSVKHGRAGPRRYGARADEAGRGGEGLISWMVKLKVGADGTAVCVVMRIQFSLAPLNSLFEFADPLSFLRGLSPIIPLAALRFVNY